MNITLKYAHREICDRPCHDFRLQNIFHRIWLGFSVSFDISSHISEKHISSAASCTVIVLSSLLLLINNYKQTTKYFTHYSVSINV